MIRAFVSLYSWRYPLKLQSLYRHSPGILRYCKRYWHTLDFSTVEPVPLTTLSFQERFTVRFLYVWAVLQVTVGMWFGIEWYLNDFAGGWQFGLAIILSYPLVLAYMLLVARGLWRLGKPKLLGRSAVCHILEWQVRRLRSRHTFTLIAVTGSVGKTSTKTSIAAVLGATRRVKWQEGNYNDRVTVPLIFFGHVQPGLFNVIAWLGIFLKNEFMLRRNYPYDVVVVELGTDRPGNIREFAYLKPDVVVVTAVAPEHMEQFRTLDAVAEEELTVLNFSKQALINRDDVPSAYLKGKEYQSYGLKKGADYTVSERSGRDLQGQTMTLHLGEKTENVTVSFALLGDQGAKIALAAAATAHLLEVSPEDIKKGMEVLKAFSGRMQILAGRYNTTLIDDTYNATPIATKAALDVLYAGDAPQRIAILGSMNELGEYTPEAHREVGAHCDPEKLDFVVTVGADANRYLAPTAEAQGCTVYQFTSPYEAGDFVNEHLKEGAVVLAKGSQNGVFTEEALKVLLADKTDVHKLVRQSAYWMGVKSKQFKS